MADLYKALAQIHAIRGQLARGTNFAAMAPKRSRDRLAAAAAAVFQSMSLKTPAAARWGTWRSGSRPPPWPCWSPVFRR